MGCKMHVIKCMGEESLYPMYFSAYQHLEVPVNAVHFHVALALSHDCPKWQLLRSQTILLVLTIMTERN